jgi:branched-chain amino acid transport system permease protein
MVTLTYGFGVALAGFAGVLAAPVIQVTPLMGSEPDHRRVRGGGDRRHGLDPGLDPHRPGAGRDRGPDQGVLSGRLGVVVFVVMVIVLLLRPAGLFGKEK